MTLSIQAANSKDKRAGIPEMQHRHFAFIAQIISDLDMAWGFEKIHLANSFADELTKSNPRFDRARFIMACRGF